MAQSGETEVCPPKLYRFFTTGRRFFRGKGRTQEGADARNSRDEEPSRNEPIGRTALRSTENGVRLDAKAIWSWFARRHDVKPWQRMAPAPALARSRHQDDTRVGAPVPYPGRARV